MKRLLFALSLALLAGLGLGQPARAAGPIPSGCTLVAPGATTQWPGYVYSLNCAGAAGDTAANDMEYAASQNPGAAFDNLASSAFRETTNPYVANFYSTGVYLFLYDTPADYKTALGSDAATVPANAFGVTKLDATNKIPMHIAIFMHNSSGTANPNVNHVTAYQVGVAFDSVLGYITKGGIVTLPYPTVSTGSNFANDILGYDWTYINNTTNFPPCGTTGQTTGLFAYQQDPSQPAGTYICDSGPSGPGTGPDLNPAYKSNGVNKTNEAILKQILPGTFNSPSTIWAELYAISQSGPDSTNSPADYYLAEGSTNKFNCSARYQNIVGNYGRSPVAGDFNSTLCPAAATKNLKASACIRVFESLSGRTEGQYGYGNVFDCAQSLGNTDQAVNTALSLDHLGTFNGNVPIPTGIAETLENAPSYTYVFPDSQTYVAAFNAAGFTQVQPIPAQGNAQTFPYGQPFTSPVENIIVTAIIQNQIVANLEPGGNVQTSTAEVAGHELGHATDFAESLPSASTAFNTSMQNDWLQVNYSKVGTTQANSTKRLPCGASGYTGPLVGINDPSELPAIVPYCNGTVLESKYKFGQSGSAYQYVSDILIQLFSFSKTVSGINGWNPGISYPGGWAEWFAVSFAINANPDTQGGGFFQLQDQVVANGYFGCTAGNGKNSQPQGYLLWIYGSKPVTIPTACAASHLPSWWGTGIQ